MSTTKRCPHCIGGTLVEVGRGSGYWQCILCSRVTESREHTALEELKFNTTGSIPSLGSIVVSQKPFDEIETERRADADAWFHQKSAYPLHPRRGDRRDKKEEAR